jgi:hypothetical protein
LGRIRIGRVLGVNEGQSPFPPTAANVVQSDADDANTPQSFPLCAAGH